MQTYVRANIGCQLTSGHRAGVLCLRHDHAATAIHAVDQAEDAAPSAARLFALRKDTAHEWFARRRQTQAATAPGDARMVTRWLSRHFDLQA